MKKMLVLFSLLGVISCLRKPELIDWYLTLRLPIGDSLVTAQQIFSQKPDQYEVGIDSLFLLQKDTRTGITVPPPRALFTTSLQRFLPDIIDTQRSEFGSILFVMFGRVKFKGNIADTTDGYVIFLAYLWDTLIQDFDTFRLDTVPFTFYPTPSIDTFITDIFQDFPFGPHKLEITPVITSGSATFDTVTASKRVLFGAELLRDQMVTIEDTIRNTSEDLRRAAKNNRIKQVRVVINVKHSIPAHIIGDTLMARSLTPPILDTFLTDVIFIPAPKDSLGLSIDDTTFVIDILLGEKHFRILQDSLILWRTVMTADSQGNGYLKPEDSLRVWGYIEATVLTDWESDLEEGFPSGGGQ